MASKKKATTKKSSSRNASASKSLKKKTKSGSKPAATAKKTVSKKKTVAGKKAGSKKKKAVARTSAASKKTSGKKAASKKASSRKRPTPAVREEPPKRRLSTFADAVKIYEAAVRLMHKEKYDEARSEFRRMVAEFPNETELFDRANLLVQVCDKRLEAQAAKPRLKGGNDYYNVGVAQMNGGALDDALEHLEQALKLLPKAEHVLYALGALSALRGDSKNALDYLSKSIDERNENRFLAANDGDFASIAEDPEFIRLVSSTGA